MKSFTHLHNHSMFSILDGASKIDEMVETVARDGATSLGLTDHGVLYGLPTFYKACSNAGINPVLGMEAYFSDDRRDRSPVLRGEGSELDGSNKRYYHLTILAENNTGYHNLLKLSSDAYLEGFWHKPRTDWETINRYSDGLIATSGCLGGPVLQELLHDDHDAALVKAARLQEIFGRDNFFIELQDQGLVEQAKTNPCLIEISRKLNAPLLATNDCLVGDTLVTTTRGQIPISDVIVGDRVYTGENRFRVVTDKFEREMNDSDLGLFRVVSNVGTYAFEATGKHKILVAEWDRSGRWSDGGQSIGWKKVSDVERGDSLLLPRPSQKPDHAYIDFIDMTMFTDHQVDDDGFFTTKGRGSVVRIPSNLPVDDDLLFMLGFYMANGYSCHHSYKVGISGHIKKEQSLLRIAGYFERFGINPRLNIDGNSASLDFSSAIFNEMLPKLCGDGSGNKRFPFLIGEYTPLAETQLLKVVEGWFAGDGCDSVTGTLSIASTSKELIYDFAYRMIELGLPSYPSVGGARGVASNSRWATVWTVNFSSTRREILLRAMSDGIVGEYTGNKNIRILGSYWAISVSSVEKLSSSERVYDLTVDDDHSYLANLLVVSNCHYPTHDHYHAHDVLLCCQTGARISDEKRFRFGSDQYYLKTSAEMRHVFREMEEACDNTVLIGERADVKLDFDSIHLPVFEYPEQFSSEGEYLAALTTVGMRKRYGNPSQEIADRLQYELSVVETLGLSAYFLIVWDMVRFADQNHIPRGPGRGSVAGSLIAYCLNISKVDPIKHDLLFERFLNPHRLALPDIDLDFSPRGRDKMIEYVSEKYGKDHVAQIVTFGIIRARVAVRDSARVLGHPPKLGDVISKMMPELIMGESTPLWACFERIDRYESGYKNAEQLRKFYNTNPDAKEVIDVAMGLEGLVRQDGVHAAGVLITPAPVSEFVPIQRKGEDGPIVTQYNKDDCENLGLLKMDFLGLRNLDVIDDCIGFLRELNLNADTLIDSDFGMDETFQLLREGRTVGVFQLESRPMMDLLRRVQPSSIDDLAAVVALYRPGPMGTGMHNEYADRKNGRSFIETFHPDATDILSYTYQLMIYQEQAMEMAQRFAGYTMADADGLRKIIGKKLVDKMTEERTKFVQGCVDNGYGSDLGEDLFHMIESFASYAFNKSHAYGYAYIAFQTAFLKANWPVEYMAALCGSVFNDIERCAPYISETRNMGIDVSSPDINHSMQNFVPDTAGNRIVMGLSAVKFVGEGTAERLVAEREANGPYISIGNLVERAELNLRELQALILAGALDAFGTRLGLYSTANEILESHRRKVKGSSKQVSLFEDTDFWNISVPTTEYDKDRRLHYEKDFLGVYLSGNPLDDLDEDYHTGTDLHDTTYGKNDVLITIMNVKKKKTRSGLEMGILTICDRTATREAIVFPKRWSEIGSQIQENASGVAEIDIKIEEYDDSFSQQAIINNFVPVKGEEKKPPSEMDHFHIRLPRGFASNELAVSKLKGVLINHQGKVPVEVHVSSSTELDLRNGYSVNINDELVDDLRLLFTRYSADKRKKVSKINA